MRVATVDGLITLFYDGSKELFNEELEAEWMRAHGERRRRERRRRNRGHVEGNDLETLDLSDECKSYVRERFSWQQIIVVDGVTEIPEYTFYRCLKVKRVIFANTVIRIKRRAFFSCENLVFIKLSISLEYIEQWAFYDCNLSSIFIPPRCRKIGRDAFAYNKNLTIFNVSQDTELERNVTHRTKLIQSCPYAGPGPGPTRDTEQINAWLKNINSHENFALHRACASFQPLREVLQGIVQEKGLKAFREDNSIGVIPSQYLKKNPYAEVTEKTIIEDYILQMMGEEF